VLGLSAGSAFNGRLDQGAVMTVAGLKRLEPDAFVTVFFVRFAPHVHRSSAIRSLRRAFGGNMLQHVPAQDAENLARVDALPALLAALIALLAAATLAHNLFTSVRRRRHDFAALKAMGFQRRQLARSVLWQTGALVIVGIGLGIPAGLLLGRAAWSFVADQIGSVQPPVIPFGIVGICAVGAMFVAALIAAAPATQAARTRAARELHNE
jgi:predicted lysophospholipase L1 biosynthesis ABC-type transport system permease subunit